MARRRWYKLSDQKKYEYREKGITPLMYEYDVPLTSRRTVSDASIRARLVKRFQKLGRDDPEGDADQMVDAIGFSEAWYVERSLRASYKARRDNRKDVSLRIWDALGDRNLPPWMLFYPEENW